MLFLRFFFDSSFLDAFPAYVAWHGPPPFWHAPTLLFTSFFTGTFTLLLHVYTHYWSLESLACLFEPPGRVILRISYNVERGAGVGSVKQRRQTWHRFRAGWEENLE